MNPRTGSFGVTLAIVLFAFVPMVDAQAGRPACKDGVDNDGDGYTDFPADPGCSSANDKDEYNASRAAACGDGFDNDGDGSTDYPADPGCSSGSADDDFNARTRSPP